MPAAATVHLLRTSGDAADALLGLSRTLTGIDSLSLARACPRCGSSDHGRPVLRGVDGVSVSLARPRDAGCALVAVCRDRRVGVDVENAGAAAFEGFDDVALHPLERCSDDAERTRLWVRKEALLKAHGMGLAFDPRAVRLGADGAVLEGPAGTVIDVARDRQVMAVAVTPPSDMALAWHGRTTFRHGQGWELGLVEP